MSSSSSRVVHTPELFISIFFCYQFLFQFLHKSVRPGSSTRFSLRSADVRTRCLLLAQSGHALRCNVMSAIGGKADIGCGLTEKEPGREVSSRPGRVVPQPRAIRPTGPEPVLAVGFRSADRRPRAAAVLMFRAALGAGRIGFIPSTPSRRIALFSPPQVAAPRGESARSREPARQHDTLRFSHHTAIGR